MSAAATPMLQQYWQIRAQYTDPHIILFFRLGDFYEMFFDDAIEAARILDIALTTRNRNDPNPVPLCGVPYHAAEGYIAKLIEAGKKVAICEQVEDPKTAKGVVRREVVRVVTPGAVLTAEQLPTADANFLAAVHVADGRYGLAVIDVSTGDFRATEMSSVRALYDELRRLEPREVLVPGDFVMPEGMAAAATPVEAASFDVAALPALAGCDAVQTHAPHALPAAAAIWQYLHYVKLGGDDLVRHVPALVWYRAADFLVIDDVTRRNLELTHTLHDGAGHGTLLWLLDRTRTALGARLLRDWLRYPLGDLAAIRARHDAVESLCGNVAMQQGLADALGGVADLERICGRVLTQQCNARDLVSLRDSLRAVPALRQALAPATGLLADAREVLDPCADVVTRIADTLVDDPPLALRQGGLMRAGVDATLDELRTIHREGKGFIARLEVQERQRTGIHSLKVRYNRVFGYYLEVTNTHKDKVPDDYTRKQTLANAERYITPALKAFEEKVTTAQERLEALEYELFAQLREAVAGQVARIRQTARQVALVDCLAALAIVAQEGNYCRPQLVEAPVLQIQDGRHPVIERLLRDEAFVPNDCVVGSASDDAPTLLMITGPNMAGKSTVMRQVALITLLAHMGSFVPAASAVIGRTDRIFTRVGAADNLARGQSTFMVEMTEAATILREATAHSLILIDELGRGTSTFDGISIAWAVAEYLHDAIGARTLFATHYHELAGLAESKSRIANLTMAVKEWNDQIIFLRRLVPGAANRSYGIHVAQLAGLPEAVTTRARAVLANLEQGNRTPPTSPPAAQLPLFAVPDPVGTDIVAQLRTTDLHHMTPFAALQLLGAWRKRVT